jgi:signal transduction histidine kinase
VLSFSPFAFVFLPLRQEPLNAIISNSMRVLNHSVSPLGAEQRDALAQGVASAHTLLLQIDNMLESTELRARSLDLAAAQGSQFASSLNVLAAGSTVNFSLTALLRSLHEFALQRGVDKWDSVDLLISRRAQCPTALQGDAHRLALVLRNLLDNAIKFTAAGMVCVHVDFEPIDSAADAGGAAGRHASWGGAGGTGDDGDDGDDQDMACPSSSQLSTAQLRRLLHRNEQAKLSRTPGVQHGTKKTPEIAAKRLGRVDSSRVLLQIRIDDSGPGLSQAARDHSAADLGGSTSAGGSGSDDRHDDDAGDAYFRSTSESGMGLGLGIVRAAVQSLGGTVAFHSGNPLAPGLSVTVRVPMGVLPTPLLESLKEKLPLLIPPHAPPAAVVATPTASTAVGLAHAATDMVASLTAMLGGQRNVRRMIGGRGGGEDKDAARGSASGGAAHGGFDALRVALFLQSPALGAALARVLTAAGAHVLHCASEPEALQLVVAQRAHVVVYDAVRGDIEREREAGGSGDDVDDDGGDEFDRDDDEAIGDEIGVAAEREWRATAAAPTAFDRMLAAAMRAMPAEHARHAAAIKLLPFGATLPSTATASSSSPSSPSAASPAALPSLASTATPSSSPAAASSTARPPCDDVDSIILLRKPIDFTAMLTVRIALSPMYRTVFLLVVCCTLKLTMFCFNSFSFSFHHRHCKRLAIRTHSSDRPIYHCVPDNVFLVYVAAFAPDFV